VQRQATLEVGGRILAQRALRRIDQQATPLSQRDLASIPLGSGRQPLDL
jgi:hypothetical protein